MIPALTLVVAKFAGGAMFGIDGLDQGY